MFDPLTKSLQSTMSATRKAAERMNHDYIGTEHFLFGLLDQGPCVAIAAFDALMVNKNAIREEMERLVKKGKEQVSLVDIPFTPHSKKILVKACQEAVNHHHTNVDTGHLLLGMLMVEDGLAAQVLFNHRINLKTTRTAVESAWATKEE